jgi:hypothetical protein
LTPIDVAYLPYVSGGSATLYATTDVLTVSEGGQTYTQQLSENYAGYLFDLTPDGNGGTDVTMTTAAANYAWNGSNADWYTAADWIPSGVPGVGDDAIIPSGIVFLESGDAGITVGSVTINSGGDFEISDPALS